MADDINSQSIDQLHLDIKVTGLNKKTISLLDNFSKSLNVLDEALTPELMKKLNKLSNISFAIAGLKQYLAMIKKMGATLRTTNEDLEPNVATTPNTNIEESTDKQGILPKTLSLSEKIGSAWSNFLKAVGKTDDEIKGINSKIGKLWGQIKRIALYRAIRSMIKFIASTITQGIQNLAKYDKSFNNAMSSLSTSVVQIGNSLALMIAPIIELLAPVVSQIAQAFIMIGNEVSRISAIMKGVGTYTKISADYAKDYAKQLQNARGFSFDTFTSLSGNDDSSMMFTTEEVENGKQINGYFVGILAIIGAIAGYKIASTVAKIGSAIKSAFDIIKLIGPVLLVIGGVVGTIGAMVDIITNGVTWQNMIIALTSILALVTGIVLITGGWIPALIAGLVAVVGVVTATIIHYWEQISGFFIRVWDSIKSVGKLTLNLFIGMLNGIIKGFETVVNFMINFINDFTSGLSNLWTWIGIPAIPAIPNVSWSGIQYLANGGVVDNGTMFVAGEAGAEIVSDLGGGKTGVTNMEQLTQAFVNAIYQTNILGTIEESGNIYLDSERIGKKIGQTQGIRDSLNRTNPNLRLR